MKFLSSLRERISNNFSKLSPRQALLIAGIGGLTVAMAIYLYMSSADISSKQAADTNTVKIVVAAKDIAPHTTLTDGDLKLAVFPKATAPAHALTDISAVIGKIAQFNILAGDAITEQKLFKNAAAATFIGSIPPECRAVTVPLTNITGVASFIKPGEYVDVMVINKSQNGDAGKLLLQDVLVLAINNIDTGNHAKKADNEQIASATLAVDANEVLRLATAAQKGLIYLSLRPLHPKDPFLLLTDYTDSTASKGSASPPTTDSAPVSAQAPPVAPSMLHHQNPPTFAPAASSNNTAPNPNGITVIKGTAESVVNF